MKAVTDLAWKRLKIISAIVGDVQSRAIAMLFYCTVLVPFGLASRLFTDPLRIRRGSDCLPHSCWLEREPVSNDLDAAKQQG